MVGQFWKILSNARDGFHSDCCNVEIFVVLVFNKFYMEINIVFSYFLSIKANKNTVVNFQTIYELKMMKNKQNLSFV